MVVEIVGGILAGSLAIITDAAHLLADVSGFIVSLVAIFYATRTSRDGFSYGYHRVEVLGALASVLTVWLVTGILVWEAVNRILHPEPINGEIMCILAVVGIFVNIILMLVLGGHGHSHGGDIERGDHLHGETPSHDHTHEHHENLNLKGAVVHVLGDLVQSVGVAIAGFLIWWNQENPAWYIADPICTILFAILVLWTTSGIIQDISAVLMESTPRGIDPDKLTRDFTAIEGVDTIHDLHVWSLTPGIPLLAVHVDLAQGYDPTTIIHQLQSIASKYRITHTTFQVVQGGHHCPCSSAMPDPVLA